MGGAAAAVAASVCCAGPAIGPLLISLLGIGPAVAVASLRPYTGVLLACSGLLIAGAFWMNARQKSCGIDRRAIALRSVSRALSWVSAVAWFGAVVAAIYSRAH
jgi:hypothetical protein